MPSVFHNISSDAEECWLRAEDAERDTVFVEALAHTRVSHTKTAW